jgi:intracellular septation protein
MRSPALSFFFGGLLPILAFTLIEDNYGPIYGTIAGMVFGIGEIIFEKIKYHKVATITWIGNILILVMGLLSIISQDGFWFKLQPAIFEAFFAIFLWGSVILKKNFLLLAAEKQGQVIPPILAEKMNGLSIRLGIFFAIHAVIATYAALYWSTAAWAWLKGAGVTISMIVYILAEIFVIRLRMKPTKPN